MSPAEGRSRRAALQLARRSRSPRAAASQAPQAPASTMECRESEYLDDRGKCNPCKECGPGLELSKECGYGEGGNVRCTPCHPRRFKDTWGHHGCKPCLSCSLINRMQKSNCTTASDAVCGECLPGFYSKTQIGGFQDLECVPCTKQTPSSELQCHSRVSLVKVDSPIAPGQDLAIVVLTSSALVIVVLVLLTVSFLYCQRFWRRQRQRDFSNWHHPDMDADQMHFVLGNPYISKLVVHPV